MPITDLLERNSKLYGEEIALVEINPEIPGGPAGDLEGVRAHPAHLLRPLPPGHHLVSL